MHYQRVLHFHIPLVTKESACVSPFLVIRGNLGSKMGLIRKRPIINFVSWNSRTNRISIKWVNHNGWIDIFVIKENYFFCSYFRHISLCFYSNFKRESSLDAEFNSACSEYPHCILLMDPATPKTRNTWKKCDDDIIITFFQVFLVFWVAGSVKSMQCGYSLDAESNSTSNELSQSKFE